jgi:hypothetical protein
VNWIHVAQVQVHWQAVFSTVMNLLFGGVFLDKLGDWQLMNEAHFFCSRVSTVLDSTSRCGAHPVGNGASPGV